MTTGSGRALREPALVNGAASVSALTGFDPARIGEYLDAFRDLCVAIVENWPPGDHNLMFYPVNEMQRAIDLLNPIYGRDD
jgi:hypothetical protein